MTLESYELCRKKATEILTFLVSTSDREKSNEGIEHIPIAYAWKGASLKVSIMCELIEKVRNSCKENNIKILCKCCDGQWSKIVFNDKEGQPLTRMQFQKKIWYESLNMKRKDMINYLLQTSTVSEDTLTEWSNNQHILMVDGTHTIGNVTISSKHLESNN